MIGLLAHHHETISLTTWLIMFGGPTLLYLRCWWWERTNETKTNGDPH